MNVMTAIDKKSFCFILNPLELSCELPIEVIPNHFLQKANEEQIDLIKSRLAGFNTIELMEFHYQYDKVPAGGTGHTFKSISSEKWRYWVIAFTGANHEIGDLDIAAALLRDDFRLGFTFIYWEGHYVFGLNPEFVFNYFNKRLIGPDKIVVLGEETIKELGQLYTLLKQRKTEWPDHYRTAQRFHYLKALPEHSEFAVIGYFSVIESMITHAPKLSEPMDSLTHQMKTKFSLLAKRFHRPLDYNEFFGTLDGDKVWGKLYSYRSKIAHGEAPDFTSDFKLLKSSANAINFLRESSKLLIICALNEPQLISDLKRC